MINSVMSAGIQGVQTGQRNMANAADQIAKANNVESTTDLAMPLVELEQSKLQTQASAKVIAAADATLGSLIDIKV